MRRPTLDYLKTESGSGLVLAGGGRRGDRRRQLAARARDYFDLHRDADPGPHRRLRRDPQPRRLGARAADAGVLPGARHGAEVRAAARRASNPRRLALPALAAAGRPGRCRRLVYLALNRRRAPCRLGDRPRPPTAPRRWRRSAWRRRACRTSLRVLLMTVAIADNLAAVVLTAILDDGALDGGMLAGAAAVLGLLACSRAGGARRSCSTRPASCWSGASR